MNSKSRLIRKAALSIYKKTVDSSKKIRKQKNYNQLKVAMALSISRESLSHYETGKRSPDVDMLVKLSKYYDVSIDYLILGKELKSSKDRPCFKHFSLYYDNSLNFFLKTP